MAIFVLRRPIHTLLVSLKTVQLTVGYMAMATAMAMAMAMAMVMAMAVAVAVAKAMAIDGPFCSSYWITY